MNSCRFSEPKIAERRPRPPLFKKRLDPIVSILQLALTTIFSSTFPEFSLRFLSAPIPNQVFLTPVFLSTSASVHFRSLPLLRTFSALTNFLDSLGVYLREELLLIAATPVVLLFSRRSQPGVARSAPSDRVAPEIPVYTDRLVWSSARLGIPWRWVQVMPVEVDCKPRLRRTEWQLEHLV